jgi:hypothetical protein
MGSTHVNFEMRNGSNMYVQICVFLQSIAILPCSHCVSDTSNKLARKNIFQLGYSSHTIRFVYYTNLECILGFVKVYHYHELFGDTPGELGFSHSVIHLGFKPADDRLDPVCHCVCYMSPVVCLPNVGGAIYLFSNSWFPSQHPPSFNLHTVTLCLHD